MKKYSLCLRECIIESVDESLCYWIAHKFQSHKYFNMFASNAITSCVIVVSAARFNKYYMFIVIFPLLFFDFFLVPVLWVHKENLSEEGNILPHILQFSFTAVQSTSIANICFSKHSNYEHVWERSGVCVLFYHKYAFILC